MPPANRLLDRVHDRVRRTLAAHPELAGGSAPEAA